MIKLAGLEAQEAKLWKRSVGGILPAECKHFGEASLKPEDLSWVCRNLGTGLLLCRTMRFAAAR